MRSIPLFFLAVCLPSAIIAAENRHALILCNQNYSVVGALKTPLAEAKAAEETLKKLGFAGNITVVTDANTAKMTKAVDAFAAKLTNADVALFFYGGHAVQVGGENYFLGVDSDPATASQLAYKALPLGRVLTNLEGSGARLNLLILDCCRDNPLPVSGRSIGSTRGLAAMANAPKGTFIAYAADANQQAWDAHGSIGLYGSVLFEKMKIPGLRLEDIFIQTREEVAKIASEKYQHQQEPAEYSKVSGAFYFLRPELEAGHSVPKSKEQMAKTGLEFSVAPTDSKTASATPTVVMAEPFVTSQTPSKLNSIIDRGEVGKTFEITLPHGVKMSFCFCPPGNFTMGSSWDEEGRSDDEEAVQVFLDKGFWMGQTEVTQKQWTSLMERTHSAFKGDDLPVEQVSWEEAKIFIGLLNQRAPPPAGWVYGLPTEAQWEYACRSGTKSAFSFGDSLTSEQANFDGNHPYGTTASGPYLARTRTVGSYAPNSWGLYDMHGNVWEWCEDRWDGSWKLRGGISPVGRIGSMRIGRGGSWGGSARRCRSAYRDGNSPSYRSSYLGFRSAIVPMK